MKAYLLLGLLLLCGVATASSVYKWTDQYGRVHYGAKPPQQGVSEKIFVRSQTAVSNDDKSEEHRSEMRKRLLKSYERERELKKRDAEKQAQQKKRTSLYCKQLERSWKNLHHAGPLYFDDKPGGEREFLSEQQRMDEKSGLQKLYRKECNKDLPVIR